MYQVKITNKEDFVFDVESDGYKFTIGPKEKGITPPATLLASLGSCIGVYIRKYAEGAKLNLGEVKINIEAEFSKEPPACFREINVSVDLDGAGIDQRRKQAMLAFIKNCPIHNTLAAHPQIAVKIN